MLLLHFYFFSIAQLFYPSYFLRDSDQDSDGSDLPVQVPMGLLYIQCILNFYNENQAVPYCRAYFIFVSGMLIFIHVHSAICIQNNDQILKLNFLLLKIDAFSLQDSLGEINDKL